MAIGTVCLDKHLDVHTVPGLRDERIESVIQAFTSKSKITAT